MKKQPHATRRRFLLLASTAPVAAAIVPAATQGGEPAPAPAARDEVKSGTYRETDHVRRYYDLSRF